METEHLLAQIEISLKQCDLPDTDKKVFRQIISTAPTQILQSIIDIFSDNPLVIRLFIQNVVEKHAANTDPVKMKELIEKDDRIFDTLLTNLKQ